jgi:hypothetical protein
MGQEKSNLHRVKLSRRAKRGKGVISEDRLAERHNSLGREFHRTGV